uniref:Uncharacterized protein n=1 Tax=Cannabis sativa TaxID=3483 RepID=A0A803PLH6_CANSA
MDLNQDLQESVIGTIESVPITLVEGTPAVIPRSGETLETVPEDEPTAREGSHTKAKGKRRAKTPPDAEAYSDSVLEMDQKANYLQSYGITPQSTKIVEITTKKAQYKAFSKEQLKAPKEVKEAIATDLAIIFIKEEEISERFVATYPNMGNPGANTLERDTLESKMLKSLNNKITAALVKAGSTQEKAPQHPTGQQPLRPTSTVPPSRPCTSLGKIPPLGFSFPMRPTVLGHNYITKASESAITLKRRHEKEQMMRENAIQTIQDAADKEARAKKYRLHSLNMSYAMVLYGLWQKDPTVLRLLGSEEEEFTKKVLDIHKDTTLNSILIIFLI